MIPPVLTFIVSLAVLVKSSDLFVKGASKLSTALNINPFVTGVLIVGLGTSLPELVSSIIAALNNAPSIISGNAVGSNIANILLVVGLAAIISREINITHDILKKDLPAVLVSVIVLYFTCEDRLIDKTETIILISMMIIYLALSGEKRTDENRRATVPITLGMILFVILPPIGIFLGAKYTVESVISIGSALHISPGIIALSAVSLGTSLPEIIVTIQAARRGEGEIAIGNVTGSNIFNIFAVIGIPGLFGSFPVPEDIVSFSIPFLIASTLLYIFIVLDKKIVLLEGFLMIAMYVYFLLRIFSITGQYSV